MRHRFQGDDAPTLKDKSMTDEQLNEALVSIYHDHIPKNVDPRDLMIPLPEMYQEPVQKDGYTVCILESDDPSFKARWGCLEFPNGVELSCCYHRDAFGQFTESYLTLLIAGETVEAQMMEHPQNGKDWTLSASKEGFDLATSFVSQMERKVVAND